MGVAEARLGEREGPLFALTGAGGVLVVGVGVGKAVDGAVAAEGVGGCDDVAERGGGAVSNWCLPLSTLLLAEVAERVARGEVTEVERCMAAAGMRVYGVSSLTGLVVVEKPEREGVRLPYEER